MQGHVPATWNVGPNEVGVAVPNPISPAEVIRSLSSSVTSSSVPSAAFLVKKTISDPLLSLVAIVLDRCSCSSQSSGLPTNLYQDKHHLLMRFRMRRNLHLFCVIVHIITSNMVFRRFRNRLLTVTEPPEVIRNFFDVFCPPIYQEYRPLVLANTCCTNSLDPPLF